MLLRYLFYTSEGSTTSPLGQDLENMQILGTECGRCVEDASEQLFENNPWILNAGFDPADVQYQMIVDARQVAAIRTVTDYLRKLEGKKSDTINRVKSDFACEETENRKTEMMFKSLNLLCDD